MKRILLIFAVLFVILAAIIFFQTVFRGNNTLLAKNAQLSVDRTKISLEIADEPAERQKGLSNRKSIPENQGMLFIFDGPDYHEFWMKDMQFPIDIIFLNGTKVVTVYGNVPPMAQGDEVFYGPDEPADRVIELNAGQAEKYKIEKGTTLNLKL